MESVQPRLVSLFPIGGQQGSTFEVEVRGQALQGALAVWFEGHELSATILELTKAETKPKQGDQPSKPYQEEAVEPDYQAVLRVQVPKAATLGLHLFRMVTPRGLSNALALQVVSETVVPESTKPHQSALEAQVLPFPSVVNGKLAQKGEKDFYSFEVAQGEELLFSVRSDLGPGDAYQAEAGLTLYQKSGSWFDPERVVRLVIEGPALSWEPVHRYERTSSAGKFTLLRRLTHRFAASGRYFLSVGTFVGAGDPRHAYQLRIVRRRSDTPQWVLGKLAHPDASDWMERDSATLRQLGSFRRPLEPDRLAILQTRSGARPEDHGPGAPTGSSSGDGGQPTIQSSAVFATRLNSIAEREPNDSFDQAGVLKIPSLIEGAVQQPGDVDTFRFTAQAGQRLAFEIETPQISPPQFNPWLKVFDSEGRQLVANIYMEYGGDGDDVNKTLERKTIYTFEQEGIYFVEVRDLTSVLGGRLFVYRLLVRPQIPHLGRVEVSLGVTPSLSTLIDKTDRINLSPEQVKEMVIICEKEEDFQGEIALTIDNLPSGVQAWVSTPAEWTETLMRGVQYRPLNVEVMNPGYHRPERSATTILLWASHNVPATAAPRFLQVLARPVIEGKAGPAILVGEIPFMIVQQPEETPVLTSSR